jgi:hypothetical protein
MPVRRATAGGQTRIHRDGPACTAPTAACGGAAGRSECRRPRLSLLSCPTSRKDRASARDARSAPALLGNPRAAPACVPRRRRHGLGRDHEAFRPLITWGNPWFQRGGTHGSNVGEPMVPTWGNPWFQRGGTHGSPTGPLLLAERHPAAPGAPGQGPDAPSGPTRVSNGRASRMRSPEELVELGGARQVESLNGVHGCCSQDSEPHMGHRGSSR